MDSNLKQKLWVAARRIATLMAGYFVAIGCFRQSIWVDQATGEVQTRVSIFPFTMNRSHRDRAFEMYFNRRPSKDRASRWLLVNSSGFLPSSKDEYTLGEMLLSAERYLIQADIDNECTARQRRELSKAFFNHLDADGVVGAHRFALSIVNGAEEMNRSESQDEPPPK